MPDRILAARLDVATITTALKKTDLRFNARAEQLATALQRIQTDDVAPMRAQPTDIQASIVALNPGVKRFHGAKVSLGWFPGPAIASPCADKFGYMSSAAVRAASKLPFDPSTTVLLQQLGASMADPARAAGPDSTIPAGFTYFGQFVDHDITLDVTSSFDVVTDATTINNMRTPALDLDSVYSRGPALNPYLYHFPSSGPGTAIKFQMGSNIASGPGGPGGAAGSGGMIAQTRSDVPRVHTPAAPADATSTALIGDPRNDENLIVSQFHHSMLRFHNKVVDLLVLANFSGDIFVEAKRIVTHHYQWAVVNDYLKRVCGAPAVAAAMTTVTAPIGSSFAMPVEFSVAAYRFGHSMIRDVYWLSFSQIGASLADVFNFIRPPQLPVLSNWVVDFNAFFDPLFPVPVHNKAKQIDAILAAGLNSLPGFPIAMQSLATRNLRRAQAMGLPSGQAMAGVFGVAALTEAQLKTGLPASEIAILDANGGLLKTRTPLWYYILREAKISSGGNALGPVGARIVAETFVRMLKRDAGSYLNASPAFVPSLPAVTMGDFTVADLLSFAGVTVP